MNWTRNTETAVAFLLVHVEIAWYYSGMTFRGSAFRLDGPVLESVAFNVDK